MGCFRQFRRRQDTMRNPMSLDDRIAFVKRFLKSKGVKNIPQPFMTTKQKRGYHSYLLQLAGNVLAQEKKEKALGINFVPAEKKSIIQKIASKFRRALA